MDDLENITIDPRSCDHPEKHREVFDDYSYCLLCKSRIDSPSKPAPLGVSITDGIKVSGR
jgi:hypothetical protein